MLGRMLIRKTTVAVLAMTLLCSVATPAHAEWQPPEDNVFTEKQLDSYLKAMKEYTESERVNGAEGQQMSGVQAMMLATGLGGGGEFGATLRKHGLSVEEFAWLSGQVMSGFTQIQMEKMFGGAESGTGYGESIRQSEAEIEQAKKQIQDARQQLSQAQGAKEKALAEAAVEVAEADLESKQASLAMVKAQARVMRAAVKQQEAQSDVPKQNIALLRAKAAEVEKLFGNNEQGKAGEQAE